jgi:group I intron endonuclease
MGCIYRIRCKTTNKSYIGQYAQHDTPIARYSRHLRDARKGSKNTIHQAIRKYGEDNFELTVLCVCSTREELDLKEDEYITEFNSMVYDNGYNMIRGGRGRAPNPHHTEDHKKRMREWHKERKAQGITMSDETKARISKARQGQKCPWDDETKGRVAELSRANATGVIFTEERKRKIGEKSKGRKATLGQTRTEEQRKNIGNASRGRKHSEETKQQMSEKRKAKQENNPNINNCHKLKDSDVIAIRKNSDNLNRTNLAKKYGVCIGTITRIIKGLTYTHVKDEIGVDVMSEEMTNRNVIVYPEC